VRRRDQALGLALAASFAALFVHALFYSGFLEDPITWLVFAVAAGWLSWHEGQRTAAERARQRAVTTA
jgi:nicotinamide riboside transporter PnuC